MPRRPPGLSVLTVTLRAADKAGDLRYLGTDRPDDGRLAVEVNGQLREYPARQMLDWLEGFTAGKDGYLQPPERRDRATIATVRSVLVNPSITDQSRIRVRLVMQQDGVGVVELAKRIGVTTKSVTESLRWLAPGSIGISAALGRDQTTRPDLAAVDPDTPLAPEPPAGWEEPEMLTRLRLLGYAHEQGVIAWVDPVEVNRASHARAFDVLVGDQTVQVRADAVRPWLVGVADAIGPDLAQQMYVRPPEPPK